MTVQRLRQSMAGGNCEMVATMSVQEDKNQDLLNVPQDSGDVSSAAEDEVDPLSHHLYMTKLQWVRTFLLGAILVPIRLLCILLSVSFASVLCFIALRGLDEDQRKGRKPITGWRLRLRYGASYCGRIAINAAGLRVTVKGRQVPSDQAPILVTAPHSTFFDAFAAFWTNVPYCVSRYENRSIPIVGRCFDVNQAVLVRREDPFSRQNTIQEIIRRSSSTDPWPPLIIFPEGSTTNRKALMTFKQGAFIPGKPVQPVVIRYPNKIDTVTWTWNQDYGALWVIFLTLAQPYTRAEIEFLPVYNPSPEEKIDPKQYAANVREVMAVALGVPTSDATYEEAKAKFDKRRRKKKDILKKQV